MTEFSTSGWQRTKLKFPQRFFPPSFSSRRFKKLLRARDLCLSYLFLHFFFLIIIIIYTYKCMQKVVFAYIYIYICVSSLLILKKNCKRLFPRIKLARESLLPDSSSRRGESFFRNLVACEFWFFFLSANDRIRGHARLSLKIIQFETKNLTITSLPFLLVTTSAPDD